MSSGTTPQTRRFYRPELDVLRFFCFLLVFVSHSIARNKGTLHNAIFDSCGYGVPVFFLLSSFLITHMLLLERERTNTVHLGSFYVRRILRIWPLYYSVFALCWLLSKVHFFVSIPLGMVLCFVFLSGNWFVSLEGLPGNPASVLWSVSVEEQYYLLWPLLIRSGGLRFIKYLSFLVIPLSYLSIALFAMHGTPPDIGLWSNTFVQMQFFAFGSLLAIYLKDTAPSFTLFHRFALLALMAGSWIGASLCRVKRPDDLTIPPGSACLGYFLMAIGAVAMFLAFYGLPIGQSRMAKALTYLGKISYGLYVFHSLAISTAENLLKRLGSHSTVRSATIISSFIVTILAAMASYRWLETPFLKLKERFTFVSSRAV